jgi:hypothetical protein
MKDISKLLRRKVTFFTHYALTTCTGRKHLFRFSKITGSIRGSSVTILTTDRGSIRGRKRLFFLVTASPLDLGPIQPPNPWVQRALPLLVRRSEREADQSPPSSAEFKNARSYTSTTSRCSV